MIILEFKFFADVWVESSGKRKSIGAPSMLDIRGCDKTVSRSSSWCEILVSNVMIRITPKRAYLKLYASKGGLIREGDLFKTVKSWQPKLVLNAQRKLLVFSTSTYFVFYESIISFYFILVKIKYTHVCSLVWRLWLICIEGKRRFFIIAFLRLRPI